MAVIGYVKLWRALLDSEQMSDDWLCRLFIWCLLRANYEPARYRGQDIQPGQFIAGRMSAAQELHVSPSKWYRGIERLIEMGCVTAETNSNWTTLTICNWQTYQEAPATQRTADEQPVIQRMNSQRTAGDTTSGQPADTIKEGKKERREEGKKEIPPSPQGGTPAKKPKPTDFAVTIPESLNSPQFVEAWAKWQQHCKEIRKPLTETRANTQIGKLVSIGAERAVIAIEHSIAGGWQGIFEPNNKGRKDRGFFDGIQDFANEGDS